MNRLLFLIFSVVFITNVSFVVGEIESIELLCNRLPLASTHSKVYGYVPPETITSIDPSSDVGHDVLKKHS